ncbi:GvpL/GvpF family gas vesicle protein [Streptomyces fragilis]|uniref:GvpL/GvpF family gas vesicle protein n=1 Tax=Streptomyces fragilis TaxID=67301 RepID=A0ABV2YLM0_9ACTN|nr:GvpL/GvpF family gas vesicle protein [Streptomyces fragilis]
MSSSDTGTVTYLFALCASRPPREALSAVPGHPGGGPLRTLEAGEVVLVVQDVPAGDFQEQALTERLDRSEELERCALAHHRGVAAAASHGPVVPLPLATVYLSDDNAVAAVTAREETVLAALKRLAGRTEWAVKVHASVREAPAPPSPPPPSPAPSSSGSAEQPATAGAGGGRSYLSRASARRRVLRDRQERARALALTVDRALRAYAVDAASHRPQSEQLTGVKAPQLLNAAYLVDDARRAEFVGALEQLRADERLRAVEISWSGPWVPYSFARPEQPAATAGAGAGAP